MTLPRRTPSKPSLPLLPCPLQHAPERLGAVAQVGAPAVVLEPGDHARAGRRGRPRSRSCRSAARRARARSRGRRARRRAAPRRRAGTSGRAAGSRRRRRARPRRGRRPRAGRRAWSPPCRRPPPPGRGPGRRPCRRGRRASGSSASPIVDAVVLEADPAPLAARAQHRDVAAVGVDVHQLGVERQHAQRSRRLQHHDGGPHVVAGRAARPGGRGPGSRRRGRRSRAPPVSGRRA